MSKKRALVWASLVMIAIASCLVFYRYLTQNSQRSRATGDIAVNIVQTSSVGFNNLPSGSEFTAGVVFNAASVGKISAFRLALGYNANVLDYLGVVGLYPDAGVDNVIEQKTGTGQNAKILIVKTYRTSINNLINNTVVNFKFKIKDGVVGSYPAALRVITSESGAVGPKADGSAYRYVMPGDETQDIRIVAAASSSSSSSLSSSSSSSSSQPSSSSSSSSRSSSSSSSSSSAASSSSRSSSSSSNSSSSSSVSSRSSSSSSVSTNCGCDTALNCGTGCSFSQYASSE
ncbi:MAG: hypothetical protein M1342_00160, partial [Patescibacteria group bacterium]|nr:hypothetical protein [Patescibacteria group bacterium]